jgi:hypothetical protein
MNINNLNTMTAENAEFSLQQQQWRVYLITSPLAPIINQYPTNHHSEWGFHPISTAWDINLKSPKTLNITSIGRHERIAINQQHGLQEEAWGPEHSHA